MGRRQPLMLNAHLDTIGVEGISIERFGTDNQKWHLYECGTLDMKASLAENLTDHIRIAKNY